MKPIITILLIVSFVVGSSIIVFSQNPEQIYQKGLMKEEGEGKLHEAIAIYKQIVEIPHANNSIQAKALLHVGLCYEKLGKEEATKAYQNLVNNFPGQKNEVAIAKERLSKLLVDKKALKTPLKPNFRKIQTPFRIPQWCGSRLSPDGKIMAFGSENYIWTVPIPGKVDPDLAGEPNKLEGGSDVLGEGLTWSGDGRFIAFSRAYSRDLRGGATRINFRAEGAHIDVIPSSGGEPKRIPIPQWVDNNGDTFRQQSLSHDGKKVAFDSGKQIYVASVETGDIIQVTKDGGISPSFSPDGMKIAYITPGTYQANPPARLNEVWVISVDGNNPIKVSGGLNENLSSKSPTWSPDGRMIAFGRIITGAKIGSEVCIVQLSDQGKPIAPPVQIKLPLFSRDFLTGWTSDNKIGLLMETPYHEYVYTVSISGGKATQVSPLDKLAGIPNWSPDGERIYFRWNGGGIAYVPGNGGKVNVHSGLAKVRKETGFFTIYPGTGNSVSPNGKSVVFSGGTVKAGPNIYTIPVEGGEPKLLTSIGKYPCWSPDGKWIAYLAPEDIGDNKFIGTIFKIPREGGEAKKITTALDNVTAGGIDWSPDGKTIAYFSKKEDSASGTLNLVPIAGGESREVCKIQNIIAHNNISWSPDGQKIAFVSSGKIWVVPKQGGEPVEVKIDVDARIGMLDWSPDGKKIAFSGESGMKKELWFMENFLPLDKLSQKNKATEVISKSVTTRKVWAAQDTDNNGTPSPDGKFMTYLDQISGNVAMRDFSTGKTHLLTKEGTWEDPMQFTIGSIVSPNSKQVAYSWYNLNNNYEIRLTDIDNPQPKVLYGNKGEDVYPGAWSPDGKIIYARSYLNETRQTRILAINIANGTVNVLKTFDFFYWMYLCVSPDNMYIAFDVPNASDKENFDIHLISTDGKKETPLVEHPANDRLLGWFPDKNQILFKSDRMGSWDAWIVSAVNGKAAKEPKRILIGTGEITPMGFTSKGTYYYSFFSRKFTAITAPLDIHKAELKHESSSPMLGSIPYAQLSPDGKTIAYTKELRGTAGAGWYNRPLFIRDIETGKERKLLDWFQTRHPRWSPDGKSLLVVGYNKGKEPKKYYDGGIYAVEVESAKVKELVAFSKAQENDAEVSLFVRSVAEWANDQKSIYYTTNDRLINRELASGKERILVENQEPNQTLDLSSDGRTMLFSTKNQLNIIPIAGGKADSLFAVGEANKIGNAIWSPDGNFIFFTENMYDIKKGSVLWQVSAEGKNPKEVWRSKGSISSISIHPDGQNIVLSSFNQETEIWKVDNLLSNENTK